MSKRTNRHFDSFMPLNANTWRSQLPGLLEALKRGDRSARETAMHLLTQMAAAADSIAERESKELAERAIDKAMTGEDYVPW